MEQKKRRKNSKQQILQSAIDLFSQRGFHDVSVREITKGAGVKESALYNHFNSKDDLVGAILSKLGRDMGEESFPESRIPELMKRGDIEEILLYTVLNGHTHITEEVSKMWRFVYMEQLRDKRARDFVMNEIVTKTITFYEKLFRAFQEKGWVKPFDPHLLAFEFQNVMISISNQCMLLRIDGIDLSDMVQAAKDHVHFFSEYVRADR